MIIAGLLVATDLLIALHTGHAVRGAQDIAKVFVLRVENLIEYLWFGCTVIWFLGRVVSLLHLVLIDDLVSVKIVFPVLWTGILHWLVELLLLVLGDGNLIVIVDVLFCRYLLLTSDS